MAEQLAQTFVPTRLVLGMERGSTVQGELHGLLRSMHRLLLAHPATLVPALNQRGEVPRDGRGCIAYFPLRPAL